jgi:serine/threonine protein kinase
MNVHSKKIIIRDLKIDNIMIYTGECGMFENMRVILAENK